MSNKQKKCFIITPIGEPGSEIRRHVDGIIDAVLKPVLEGDFEYKVSVAHEITEQGNITKQVIQEIYESDLVVANLTGINPNVMYELAFRHSLGSPAIMIAETKTPLPFDIISERTIFYENDAKGVIELKDKIKTAVQTAASGKKENQGPIYDNLEMVNREKLVREKMTNNTEESNAFELVLRMLEDLQAQVVRLTSNKMQQPSTVNITPLPDITPVTTQAEVSFSNLENLDDEIKGTLIDIVQMKMDRESYFVGDELVIINIKGLNDFEKRIMNICSNIGLKIKAINLRSGRI